MLTRNGNKLRLKRLWGGHARFNSEEVHFCIKSHKDCYCFAWYPGLGSTLRYRFPLYQTQIWPNYDEIVQPSSWCRPFVLIITIRRSTTTVVCSPAFHLVLVLRCLFWCGVRQLIWLCFILYLCESHVTGEKKETKKTHKYDESAFYADDTSNSIRVWGTVKIEDWAYRFIILRKSSNL